MRKVSRQVDWMSRSDSREVNCAKAQNSAAGIARSHAFRVQSGSSFEPLKGGASVPLPLFLRKFLLVQPSRDDKALTQT